MRRALPLRTLVRNLGGIRGGATADECGNHSRPKRTLSELSADPYYAWWWKRAATGIAFFGGNSRRVGRGMEPQTIRLIIRKISGPPFTGASNGRIGLAWETPSPRCTD